MPTNAAPKAMGQGFPDAADETGGVLHPVLPDSYLTTVSSKPFPFIYRILVAAQHDGTPKGILNSDDARFVARESLKPRPAAIQPMSEDSASGYETSDRPFAQDRQLMLAVLEGQRVPADQYARVKGFADDLCIILPARPAPGVGADLRKAGQDTFLPVVQQEQQRPEPRFAGARQLLTLVFGSRG